jgi:tRNA(Ser,Leu) C12 N-acetylase TAN1
MTLATTDLLVSYPWRGVGPARREILRIVKRLGDEHAHVERTGVDGVALVHTNLDGREVVRRCRERSCGTFLRFLILVRVPSLRGDRIIFVYAGTDLP